MHGAELVIGVDIGTTGVKAFALDAAAVGHGTTEPEYPTTAEAPGGRPRTRTPWPPQRGPPGGPVPARPATWGP